MRTLLPAFVALALGGAFLSACATSTVRSAEVVASYATVVQPILDGRCIACHGAERPKGRLRLDSAEGLRTGGVSGYTVVPGDAAGSELVRRLHLDPDDEEHMPPPGSPPLSVQEIAAIEAWIAAGAAFEGHVPELVPFVSTQGASVAAAASTAGGSSAGSAGNEPVGSEPARVALPPAAAAPESALAALRANLVHVEPFEPGSNALRIDFAAVAADVDDARAAELLAPVRGQVADLSLARARIGDATLALLAEAPMLVRLDLRGTAVTSQGLAQVVRAPLLRELVLAQLQLDSTAVETLLACGALERVYLWRSGLAPSDLARLRSERPTLFVDAGDRPAAAVVASETEVRFTSDAPLPDWDPAVANAAGGAGGAPVNTACPVNGAPVDTAVTLVHAGRVVAFCCANCRAAFAREPERYAANLP
jgi:mono/diheme cytochrome c family protein